MVPKLLAGDIGWLCAGGLFAWMPGALVQLAVSAASGAALRPAAGRAKSCISLRSKMRPACGVGLALASLLSVSFALMIVAGVADVTHAVAAMTAGALCGAWLTRRNGHPVCPRFVTTAGCAFGAVAVAGGFALDWLMPRHGVLERGALYVAVSLGAWVLAASASAGFAGFARKAPPARHRPLRPVHFTAASPAFDDRITYGLAVTLCAALAGGFVAAGTSTQFRLSALVAACGLTSALGVRMMLGARFAASSRVLATPARAVVARADAGFLSRTGLFWIPDELLVAACQGETFDAACLMPLETGSPRRDGLHGGLSVQALPRRQRSRYGSAGQSGSGRAH